MTPTIKSFTCTSTEPYDRHYQSVVGPQANRPMIRATFDSYEQLRAWWFQQGNTKGMKVNVLDYTTPKRVSQAQGF